jgi:hypothetical protein
MAKRATKKAQKINHLGVGTIRLTKLAKAIKGGLVHRGL